MPPKKKTTPNSPKAQTPKSSTSKGKKGTTSSAAKKKTTTTTSSSKKSGKTTVTANQVLLYWPNIIGYLRAVFLFIFFYLSDDSRCREKTYTIDNWKIAVFLYFLGFVGDLMDGWVARKFNQTTLYGATLDMVIDRVATAGLLCILASRIKHQAFIYASLIALDIGSHWFHMASTATQGHHKDSKVLEERNIVLRWYYGVKWFFAYCCVGQELYYIAKFIDSYREKKIYLFFNLQQYIMWFLLAACVAKQVVNVCQLASAVMTFAEQDATLKNKKK